MASTSFILLNCHRADSPSRNASNDENTELLGVATRVIVQPGDSAKCNKQYICTAAADLADELA